MRKKRTLTIKSNASPTYNPATYQSPMSTLPLPPYTSIGQKNIESVVLMVAYFGLVITSPLTECYEGQPLYGWWQDKLPTAEKAFDANGLFSFKVSTSGKETSHI